MTISQDADQNDDLIIIDDDTPGAKVPHCVRCQDALEPGYVYPEPGPFCSPCLSDIIAAAKSFGGSASDFADRYNAKLLRFVAPGRSQPFGRAAAPFA
jgi:hypothetical protein